MARKCKSCTSDICFCVGEQFTKPNDVPSVQDNNVIFCPEHGEHSGFMAIQHGQMTTHFCTRCLMELLVKNIGTVELVKFSDLHGITVPAQ